MRSQSDFWLDLHRLADDLDKEGGADDERLSNLVAVLESMSPTACALYLENLERVAHTLNALLARCKVR